jgi:hypothetical protein
MQGLLIAGLVLASVLNFAADRLRGRIVLDRSPQQLTLRNQRAAIRLDSLILLICSFWLAYALIARSAIGIAMTAVAVAVVGIRVVRAQRARELVFDRARNSVWRGEALICPLSAVEGTEIVGGQRTSALDLRYRDGQGQAARQRLHAAPGPQLLAVQTIIADFLRSGGLRVEAG